MSSVIITRSGDPLDTSKPDPEHINFNDIGVALGNTCRWSGHTSKYYSVAEHSVILSKMVPKHLKLQALLHDSAEAYIGDIARPVKRTVPEFSIMEDKLLRVILTKANLPDELDQEIHWWDQQILWHERTHLLPYADWWPPVKTDVEFLMLQCWSPRIAGRRWIQRFNVLKRRHDMKRAEVERNAADLLRA